MLAKLSVGVNGACALWWAGTFGLFPTLHVFLLGPCVKQGLEQCFPIQFSRTRRQSKKIWTVWQGVRTWTEWVSLRTGLGNPDLEDEWVGHSEPVKTKEAENGSRLWQSPLTHERQLRDVFDVCIFLETGGACKLRQVITPTSDLPPHRTTL